MTDFIVVVILAAVIGSALRYIVKAKKSGMKCIGCAAGNCCSCGQSEIMVSSCGCGGNAGCSCANGK